MTVIIDILDFSLANKLEHEKHLRRMILVLEEKKSDARILKY